MRRGEWVIYQNKPHIVVAVSDERIAMHEIDAKGETIMEYDAERGKSCDKVVIAKQVEVEPAQPEQIPASRRPKAE